MAEFISPIKPISINGWGVEQETQPSAGLPFQKILGQAMEEAQKASEGGVQDGFDLALGNVEDLAQLQINSMKAQAMVQTAVQLTSRAVTAYKEIMQIQV